MTVRTFQVKGRRLKSLATEIDEHLTEGRDVVLNFGVNPKPERILKTIALFQAGCELELVVRHAELREYIEGATAGAGIGAGVGAAGVVLTALAVSNPISLGAVLAAAGIGALVGSLIGAGATAVHSVTVYKHNGETRIKIAHAA